MNNNSKRDLLRVLTGILFVIAVLWYLKEGGFEPLLAVVGGVIALISSFFVKEESAHRHSVNIESNIMGKGNEIHVERDDVNVSNNKMLESDNKIKVKD